MSDTEGERDLKRILRALKPDRDLYPILNTNSCEIQKEKGGAVIMEVDMRKVLDIVTWGMVERVPGAGERFLYRISPQGLNQYEHAED